MTDKPDLRAIEGGNKPKPYARREKRDLEQVVCRVCEADVGVATSMAIKARSCPMSPGLGKITRGTDAWICAYCLARGKVTEMP